MLGVPRGSTFLAQTSGEIWEQKVKAIKREPWVFTGEHQMSKNNRIGGWKLGSATNLPRDLAYVILLFGPQFRHLSCDETGLNTGGPSLQQ